jgi:hypothetical protein
MSIAELKAEVDRLSPEDRKQLTNYLLIKDRVPLTPEMRKKLAEKIDDKDPSHWISLEELEKRLEG